MKAPDRSYGYSKGVGLSYKFHSAAVLEINNVED
jgi:hypothetical protein